MFSSSPSWEQTRSKFSKKFRDNSWRRSGAIGKIWTPRKIRIRKSAVITPHSYQSALVVESSGNRASCAVISSSSHPGTIVAATAASPASPSRCRSVPLPARVNRSGKSLRTARSSRTGSQSSAGPARSARRCLRLPTRSWVNAASAIAGLIAGSSLARGVRSR